jgi:hypothetical protein
LPQDVKQQSAGLDREFVGAPVDADFDEFFFHFEAVSSQLSAISSGSF